MSSLFGNPSSLATSKESCTKRANNGAPRSLMYYPARHILAELSSETIGLMVQNFDAIAAKHLAPKERLFATSRGLIQFCVAHPQQFRNVFFGPENRNGVRAGQYINDIGAPLFGRFVQLFFDVAKEEGLPSRDDIVVAHTWWFSIFGLATLMVIQGIVPDLSDQTLVVEQTIATLWAGVQAVPRLPKSAVSKRSSRFIATKH